MKQSDLIAGLNQVLALKQQGDFDAAENACEQLVKASNRAPEAVHFLGLILKQQGQLLSAEKLIRESLQRSPGRADYHANLANLLMDTQRHAEAERAYREALRCDPEFRPARLALGRLLHLARYYEQAKAEAETLISQDEDDIDALLLLGEAHRGMRNLDAALAAFRRVVEIKPDYPPARHSLGLLLADLNEGAAALKELREARKGGIKGHQIDASIAQTLAGLGELEEAEHQLLTSLKAHPEAINSQVLLAKIRHMRGSDDFALHFRQASERFPQFPQMQLAYAAMLRGAGELQTAQQVLKRSLGATPQQPDILAELAIVQQMSADYEGAYQSAYRACQIDPNRFALSHVVIDPLMSLGRYDEALPLVREARQRLPKHQWYIAIEATVARMTGDEKYAYLYNYDRFVQPFELEVPDGWSDAATFNRDLAQVLNEMHHFERAPLDQTLRHGSQTSTSLLTSSNPVIQALLESFRKSIDAYRRAVGNDDADHPLIQGSRGQAFFNGCWSVRLQKEGFHVNHVHSQGVISSAYYVDVPEECADNQARSGWLKFGEPAYPLPGADPEYFVQPSIGRLALFPSYMWHGTTPIIGDQPRLTVAFDVVFSS